MINLRPASKSQTARAPAKTKESPLGLLIAVIADAPSDDRARHLAQFRALVLKPEYADFLDNLIKEWSSIKYSTAHSAAVPLTIEQIEENRKRNQKQAKRTAADQKAAVAKAKALIAQRMLDTLMPNGKRLSDCTGSDCLTFGAQFTKIGAAVGAKVKVGSVFDAAKLSTFLSS